MEVALLDLPLTKHVIAIPLTCQNVQRSSQELVA